MKMKPMKTERTIWPLVELRVWMRMAILLVAPPTLAAIDEANTLPGSAVAYYGINENDKGAVDALTSQP